MADPEDDFGVHHPSGAWGSVAGLPIGRSDEARGTLITSHLTLDHISEVDQPGLAPRLSEGLSVQFGGDDRRVSGMGEPKGDPC